MRKRSSWKEHLRQVGVELKPHYPQAEAAVELWAYDQLKDGFTRYQSPCAQAATYGTALHNKSVDEYNEVSMTVSRILTDIGTPALDIARAEWLGLFNAGGRFYRIPREMPRKAIARRYFNAEEDWYEDWCTRILAHVAREMGLDGQ